MNQAARMARLATLMAIEEYREMSADRRLRSDFEDVVLYHLKNLYYRGIGAEKASGWQWSELSRACELVRWNKLDANRRN
jgi:uncharacterized protein YfiM (DUF2279 family)